MNNLCVRAYAKKRKIYLWQVAEKMGITDFTFSRRLRHELTDEQRKEILMIIDQLSSEGGKEK